MNVLIVEDEKPAAKRLEQLIDQNAPELNILEKLGSIKSVVQWLENNDAPDLIFMDIQLSDGLSFEIFEKVKVTSPIIFTTAYDEYALRAFKVNSIDYLLKPIDGDDLKGALDKLSDLTNTQHDNNHSLDKILKMMEMLSNDYKTRFVIKVGEHLKSIQVKDILYFFSREKASYCCVNTGRTYLIDYTLEQLDAMLDPKQYYRINRKYIVGLDSFTDIISYSNSRLRLVLENSEDNDIIVSRDRVADFKQWLDR